MATTADDPTTELPGMPPKPKLPRHHGREIENARIALTGGASFALKDAASVEFLESFPSRGAVKIIAYASFSSEKTSEQKFKDGTMLVRTLTFTVDYIEGAPNPEASEAFAELDGGE